MIFKRYFCAIFNNKWKTALTPYNVPCKFQNMNEENQNHAHESQKVINFPNKKQRASLQKQNTKTPKKTREPFFKFGHIPPFTKVCVVLFLIIHIVMELSFDYGERFAFYVMMGFVPDSFTYNFAANPLSLLSPITSLFIHGDWQHLATNILMLLVLGIFAERTFGSRRTILYFFVCGCIGHIAYLVLSPHSTAPVIGASGAISGLFAAMILHTHASGRMGPVLSARSVWPFIAFWIIFIIVSGHISQDIAWQSHLGGFIGGLMLYSYFKKKEKYI